MRSKILLKDIPAGKFHSVIFTTYSIDLYYLEQQVLPMLGAKGIHYVSLMVDGVMLSTQLAAYSMMSENRKRNYALHGMQSKGAFHPKIIFLAGDDSLLMLIGSGNLTSSGHGRNLEGWNAVYVNDAQDAKLGIVLDTWDYLKKLHDQLGAAAQNKLIAIQDNCRLLKTSVTTLRSLSYSNGPNSTISLINSGSDLSMFEQLIGGIGDRRIKRISIISPYYDLEGRFIQLLLRSFQPDRISVILQKDFGNHPYKMPDHPKVRFYLWSDCQVSEFSQDFFHAKFIILEGPDSNFMFSGSANASIAAFGSEGYAGINEEAGLLYEERAYDYLAQLGIRFQTRINRQDLEVPSRGEPESFQEQQLVFIKAIEKDHDQLHLYVEAKSDAGKPDLMIFGVHGKILSQHKVAIPVGKSDFTVSATGHSLLYAEIRINGNVISNKQFIIDINAFEANNPSPQNRSLNQIRKLIESGSFSSQKIIDYLNTIFQQKKTDEMISGPVPGGELAGRNKWYKENSDLIHLSYEEIQERIKYIDDAANSKVYVEYKTVKLWDSIFAYLKEAQRIREESAIDEEETEDINKAGGRVIDHKQNRKPTIKESNFNRLKEKISQYLENYIAVLQSKINNNKAVKPNLIDLTMFLIVLEILLDLFTHQEKIEETEVECQLFQLEFSDTAISWSDYAVHIIGVFTLWCNQNDGFYTEGNNEYKIKMDSYIQMAFKTSVGAISLFSMINKTYDQVKIEKWKILSLKNSAACFNPAGEEISEPDDFLFFIPEAIREALGDINIQDELYANLYLIKTDLDESEWYTHPEDGITYIEKIVPGGKFLKLIHTGYDWNWGLRDYWNSSLFSIENHKWFKSRYE